MPLNERGLLHYYSTEYLVSFVPSPTSVLFKLLEFLQPSLAKQVFKMASHRTYITRNSVPFCLCGPQQQQPVFGWREL